MAYKARIVTCSTPAQLMKNIKEVMLAAGWTSAISLDGNNLMTGQDDPYGHAIGWFLKSVGESGNEDIHVHLGVSYEGTPINAQLFTKYSYVSTGGIDSVQGSIPIDDETQFTAPGIVQIEDEAIYFSGVSSSPKQLTGCIRGWGATDSAPHPAGAVVQVQLNNTDQACYLLAECYAYRDLTKYLKQSSAAAAMSKAGPASWASLGGAGDDRFNFHSLIQVVDGNETGKMRWVTDYVSSGGQISYQPFLNDPGTVNVNILSGGFFPGWSKRAVYGSNQSRYQPWIPLSATQAGRVCFIYCNMDALIVVVKTGGSYPYAYTFVGNLIRPHASNTCRSTANSLRTLTFGSTYTDCVYTDIGKPVVGAGGTYNGVLVAFNNTTKIWYVAPNNNVTDTFEGAIPVTITGGTGGGTTLGSSVRNGFKLDNVNVVIKDQKYRVLSQDVDDWVDIDTIGPISPFPALDPEETGSEEFVAGDVFPLTRTLTFASTGYVNCIASDLGKTVIGSNTGDTGYLQSYNNDTREWVIIPIDSEDEFDVAESITITGGTGAGTTIGESTPSAAGVIKSSSNLIYPYRVGTVMGEDPCPLARTGGMNNNYDNLTANYRFVTPFIPCKGTDLGSHASHRQSFRAYHQSGLRHLPQTAGGDSRVPTNATLVQQSGSYSYLANRQVDQIPFDLFELTAEYMTESSVTPYGIYNRVIGFLPMTWSLRNAAIGSMAVEDVLKSMWNAKYTRFRLFRDSSPASGEWFLVGPELLV